MAMRLPFRKQVPIRCFLERPNPRAIPASGGMSKNTANVVMPCPSCSGTANASKLEGAVIVSVALPGLEPSITDGGETPQVGNGVGPFTAQLKFTCPENPFCTANVRPSVT